MSSNYPSYSPQDQNSNASQSPWSASSHTGGGYDLTLAPINPDAVYDPFNFNDGDQYYDSLPRLQSPHQYLPEPSGSRDQEQQPPPPSNQQARQRTSRSFLRYQVSESPDPFEDFIEQDFDWQDSPRPQPNPRSQNTTQTSSVVDLTESSPQPDDNMAPQTRSTPVKKRKAEATVESRSVRPRTSATPKTSRSTPATKHKVEDVSIVDLVEIEDDEQYADFKAKQQAEAIKQQQQDDANRPVKLAEFECIICMERPTDLTVTHCGHLFCSECLHQSLYAGNGKKNCPVCRTVISTAGIEKGKGDQKKQPKNGIFVVAMKLMTANKKGKQAVRSQ
ncbi:RING-type E3 ubiquitin transferase RNF5 [Hyphodiscus hymeniophilus]|uniref:RING-type E3 ubiquitin transferase RNF5 n=1 Tax=Hyphodiscus hymeniophilus TaxID=353542 RepID=A0A9P7AWJ4_9HELO|nr:RING-type E3 ubiquitin transferase RNF5 [Hyphodiscus hymeniophilus]